MYVPDTKLVFDPNNIPLSSTNINIIDPINNHFNPIDPNFNHINNNNNNNNNIINNNNTQEIMDSISMGMDFQNPNTWTNPNNNMSHEMNYQNFDENNINIHNTATSDLLTLLHLPRCSFTSSSNNNMLQDSINNINTGHGSAGSYDPTAVGTLPYDPLFHLNLPPQPSPLLRDLMFQSLPHGYHNVPSNEGLIGHDHSNSLFGQMYENGEGSNNNNNNNNNDNNNNNNNGGIMSGLYQENGENIMNQNGIFEFCRGGSLDDHGKLGNKGPKNFVTERQRRLNFNDKYQTLRKLIPTPTKGDRASIVLDAISYIEELKRTVGELKLLVEKKRISKERTKRLKTEENNNPSDQNGSGGDQNNNNGNSLEGSGPVKPDPDDAFAGSSASQLRSSWLQRKCKDTEVDVRIVDDEVTIKLVQRKKINCLLYVSRTLDDLQLDLRHVAGGHVGDYYSYLFNSKICEGSSVYASAIANKLIEVVERQYAAASVAVGPTSSF